MSNTALPAPHFHTPFTVEAAQGFSRVVDANGQLVSRVFPLDGATALATVLNAHGPVLALLTRLDEFVVSKHAVFKPGGQISSWDDPEAKVLHEDIAAFQLAVAQP